MNSVSTCPSKVPSAVEGRRRVSVIITSAHEPTTIGRAVEAILHQDFPEIIEILVVSPDQDTINAIKPYIKTNEKISVLKDAGQGKPAALNLAFQKAKGEILVLTDGDVWIDRNSLKPLLSPFTDQKVGGVCGRPVPINSKKAIFGFWAHFLTDSAHQLRKYLNNSGQFIELSGYLLAIKKTITKQIPVEVLADDSYLSHSIANNGLITRYAPEAKIFVKYPTTLSDWFKQKRRSTFEYWQKDYSSGKTMRSPLREILWGIKTAFAYPKNIKEAGWLIFLFIARLILWLQIIFPHQKEAKKPLWLRVNSTKGKNSRPGLKVPKID